MSKIGYKLFAVILIMSITGLIITSYLVNSRVEHHFQEYINQEKMEEIEGLIPVLEELYEEETNWEMSRNFLNRYFFNEQIVIYYISSDGGLIYTNEDTPGHGRRKESFSFERANKYPVYNQENKMIASIYWDYPGQQRGRSVQETRFLDNVNDTVFFVAGIMILLSAIISYLLSRYLTLPILKMNKMTSAVARGDFNQSVEVRGNDELTGLGKSLNRMTERLKYLEKVREESTGDLVHELKTPLAIISNYLSAIEDGVFEPDRVIINEMKEELDRLKKLVGSLEQFTDTEQKIYHMDKKEINLKDIIDQVLKSFRKKAEEKKINIKIKSEQKEYIIKGDPEGLRTIFNNLISNAIKYSKVRGEIEIILNKDKKNYIIKVKDNGIGIPDKDIPFIFERFYRTDKSRSTKTGGTGLGLAITRKLVEAHGGKITVNSKNDYTIFTVILPAILKNKYI